MSSIEKYLHLAVLVFCISVSVIWRYTWFGAFLDATLLIFAIYLLPYSAALIDDKLHPQGLPLLERLSLIKCFAMILGSPIFLYVGFYLLSHEPLSLLCEEATDCSDAAHRGVIGLIAISGGIFCITGLLYQWLPNRQACKAVLDSEQLNAPHNTTALMHMCVSTEAEDLNIYPDTSLEDALVKINALTKKQVRTQQGDALLATTIMWQCPHMSDNSLAVTKNSDGRYDITLQAVYRRGMVGKWFRREAFCLLFDKKRKEVDAILTRFYGANSAQYYDFVYEQAAAN
ncbi:hypothetical protein EZV61_11185 [Corallincola luteus]|uniref:Uncharacterized protein n=1 Tax=Corallincola luteus TaxID=1775177 RepID=A0ABY2AMJ9_9GAMM|nr:hypothetical protein [Corallincola luteus]TCI02853.1 hypothetical protein EZV61_11185 [Corallincola luteus]